MAFVILWTELARNDLRAIVEYIAKDNPPAARKTGFRLIAIVESLAEFPKQTRMVPEYGQPHLREAIAGNYRLVIRIQEGGKHLNYGKNMACCQRTSRSAGFALRL